MADTIDPNAAPEELEPEPVNPDAPFSLEGRDYYVTPEGFLTNVEAGFDPSTDYPDLSPATEADYDAASAARFNRDPSGYVDPDKAFAGPGIEPAPEYSPEQVQAQLAPLPETYTAGGRDYYLTPEGDLANVEHGFDINQADVPGLMPATKADVDAAEYAKRQAKTAASEVAYNEAALLPRPDEDAPQLGAHDDAPAETQAAVKAAVNAPVETYRRAERDYYRDADGQIQSVAAGFDVRPEYPDLKPVKPEDVPYAREGQWYYKGPKGKIVTLDPSVNASKLHPELKPASAEDVRQHDLQKTYGSLGQRLQTVEESAKATVAEIASAASKEAAEAMFWGQYLHPSLQQHYDPNKYSRPEDIAPGAYTADALARREANPLSAQAGTMIPDLAVELATAGAGTPAVAANRARRAARLAERLARTETRAQRLGARVANAAESAREALAPGLANRQSTREHFANAARLAASGVVAEAGDAVISGEEFDLTDALGLWAPTQAIFEPLAGEALHKAAEGLGWAKGATRNALDNAVSRARTKRVTATLAEKDPVKAASMLRRNADDVLDSQQTVLDGALETIDQQMVDAPEKLFSRSALKKSVSDNLEAQRETAAALATRLFSAANVTGRQVAFDAYDVLAAALKKEGADMFAALRQARAVIGSEIGNSALLREAADGIDTTLTDPKTWGRAAKHHAEVSGARTGDAGFTPTVRDVDARTRLAGKLEGARAMASLTGNKRLADAVKAVDDALNTAHAVHGARSTLGDTLPDEVADLRKVLDGFPERQPKLAEELTQTLEALDLPEAWTPERVDRHIVERAAGSLDAKKELDGLLAAATEGIAAMTDEAAKAKAKKALGAAKKLLGEVDAVPDAFKRVRDFDALPKTPFERVAHKVIDAATGRVASQVAGKVSAGAAAGIAGHVGGPIGTGLGMATAFGAEHYLQPKIQGAAKKFGDYMKGKLRKWGKSGYSLGQIEEVPLREALKGTKGKIGAGIAGLLGADQALNLIDDEDDPSPGLAAAVGVFGLPLFFLKGGPKGAKGISLINAMRDLERYAAEYGLKENHHLREAAQHLFGNADGTAVYEALRVVDRHGLDLGAKTAPAQVAKVLESDVTYRYAQQHINDVLARNPELAEKSAAAAKAKTAKAAATRGDKLARAKEEGAGARALLGFYGEQLDKGLKQQGGSYTLDRTKRMLSRKSPLKLDEIEWEARHYSPGESDELITPQLTDLRQQLAERVDALGPGALQADRVAAEDEYLREVIGAALGLSGKRKAPRQLDPAVSAKSRYYARKDDFDKWRKAALPTAQQKATHDWQTMGYRILNADTRLGPSGKAEAVTEAIQKHFMSPDDARKLGAAAREINTELMAALNTAVERGQTVPGLVRRGIAIPEAEVEQLLKAKTVTSQGFMSTSVHEGTPREFAKRRAKEFGLVPVDIQIEQSTGVPLGHGEGEVTLRPGTKFEVVRAERPAPSRFRDDDDQGVIEVYLREVEPSTITAEQVRKGIAGTIPTEAKVAGGLLALDQFAGDDEDDDGPQQAGAAQAGIGIGGLALLFGRGNAAAAFRKSTGHAMERLAEKMGPVGNYVLENIDTGFGRELNKLARWGETAGKDEFAGAKAAFVDNAVSAIRAQAGKLRPIDDDAVSALERYVNAWTDHELAGYASGETSLRPDRLLDEETVMDKHLRPARGSNAGGFYRGSDGVERYVKLYDEPQQAVGEHMANEIYRLAGLPVPESSLFEREGGGIGYASEIVKRHDTRPAADITMREARDFVRGFWADVLLANWDAPGMHYDNILWPDNTTGPGIRTDNGSALKFRAQGAEKPASKLAQLSELEGFFDPKVNRSYATLLQKAGISSPKQLAEYLPDTIDAARRYLAEPGEHADPELLGILRQRLGLLEDYEKTLATAPVARRAIKLGDIAERNPLPVSLGEYDSLFAKNYIQDPLGYGWRHAATDSEIDDIREKVQASIAERFDHQPQKRLALEKYADDQVEFLRSNIKARKALPAPPPPREMATRGALNLDAAYDVKRHMQEVEAALTPEAKAGIKAFTGAFSPEIKAAQRGELDPSSLATWTEEMTARHGESGANLEAAANALMYENPTEWGSLFRGLDVTEAGLNELLTLDTFTPTSVLSTSHDYTTASGFASDGKGRPAVLRFNKVEQAAPVLHLSSSPREHEWLIPRGGGYKITGRYYDETAKKFVFDLEQIDPASKPDLTKAGALALLLGVGGAADAASDDEGGARQAGLGGIGAAGALGISALLGKGGRRLIRGTADVAEHATARLAEAAKTIADPRLQSIRKATDAAWRTLPNEQRKAMQAYTQASGPLKRSLVEESRGVIGATQKQRLDDFRAALETMAIDNPTAEAPLMRGLDMTDEQIAELLHADDVQLQNFASTTYFPAKAGEFAVSKPAEARRFKSGAENTRPVVIVFDKVDRGSPKFPSKELLDHPAIDSESEVILPPGAVFEPSHVEVMTFPDPDIPEGVEGLRVHMRQTGTEPAPVPRGTAKDAAAAKQLALSPEYATLKAADGPLSVEEYRAKFAPEASASDVRRQFVQLAHAGLAKIEGEWDDMKATAISQASKAGRFMLSLGLGLGAGAKTLLGEDDEDDADSADGEAEPGLDAEIQGKLDEADQVRQAREAALDATRQKLGYLAAQSRAQMELAARSVAQPRGVSIPVETVPGITSNAGVTAFLGNFTTVRQAYEARRAVLERHERDPMALVDDLSEQYSELADNAPDMHAQVTAQTFKVSQFIRSKLPPVTGVSMSRPEGSPPSQVAMRQFALFYSAATDPSSVVQDVQNNRVRREQIDTLKQLWPETYSRLASNVLQQIAKTRPTVQQRMRLDLLFDFGPALDKAFSPAIVASLDAYRAKQAEGAGGAPGAVPQRRSQPSIIGTSATGSLSVGAAKGPSIGA